MAFVLPKLPYALSGLEPHISEKTLSFHYGKHHTAYLNKLNELTENNKASQTLEEVIKTSDGVKLNQAGQVWNHTFYWNSMAPAAGGAPTGEIGAQIEKDFGSFDKFKDEFSKAAAGHFGSGWAWLMYCPKKKNLFIHQTHDGFTPVGQNVGSPILTCDVWEHAYYLDYQNSRPQYIKAWWNLINWEFAEKNLKAAKAM